MISRKYSRNTPEGTRDMLFEECLARRKVASVLRELFESHGYAEVMTPGLEYYEMFAGEMAGIPQESLYKMTDGHGRLLVMRPDSTMPIARLAATRLKDAPLPLRLYYAQTVYRATPSMSGRSDEIMQSGIELLGAAGKRADLEVITMAVDALRALEVEDFRIELGHAGFYKALAARLPADDEVREEIRLLIESKNYAGLGALLDTLEDTEAVRALRRLPRLFGGREVFADAAALCEGDPDTLEPLRYLEGIYTDLETLGLNGKVSIDLGLVHRTDYYTGVVFRGYVEGAGRTAVSGGRYDRLLGEFGSPMPATGFGVDNDQLAGVLLSHGKGMAQAAPAVAVFGAAGYEMKALVELRRLTNEGVRCVSSTADTAEEAALQARAAGIGRLLLVGETCVEQILSAE